MDSADFLNPNRAPSPAGLFGRGGGGGGGGGVIEEGDDRIVTGDSM